MKKDIFNSLGIDIPLTVPETIDEFNSLDTSRTNAALEEAINNVVYRDMLMEFREQFTAAVETETGILFKRVQKKDSKGTLLFEDKTTTNEDGTTTMEKVPTMVVDETEAVYFKRVLAEKNVEPTYFQSTAERVAAALVFDPKAGERATKGPSKVAQVYANAAKELIAAGKGQEIATKLATKLGVSVEPTEDSLGRAIQLNEARKRAEAAKRVVADYSTLV